MLLEGQPNFRDLGGLHTANGDTVATGEVYRSGELFGLTDDDLDRLGRLGIRTVVDLRTGHEMKREPDRIPSAASYVPIPFVPGGRGSAVERFLRTMDPDVFPPWEDVYPLIVAKQADVLGSLIRLVAEPGGRPLVFHCTTGKDRTGIASVLLLSILGVPWRDIETDYLRSNAYLLPAKAEMMDRWERELRQRGIRLDAEARNDLTRFMEVKPSYLAAARDEMVARNGSVAAYIRDALGVDEATQESLRAQLLRAAS